MKKEYKVTRHVINTTEEEKEEIYKQLADIFIRMALKERENERSWWKMSREQKIYCKIGQAVCNVVGATMFVAIPMATCALAGYLASLFL